MGQRHFHRQPPRHRLLLHCLQRVVAHDHLGGPIRGQEQQPRRLPPPRQHAQQVNRGDIAPVQVLQHYDQRPLGAEHLQRLHHLS